MDILVIDVGGTTIKFAVMTEQCEILEKGAVDTPYEEGIHGFAQTVYQIYQEFEGRVRGIAMCMPGIIDTDAGFCLSGGSLEYNVGQPVKKLLEEQCHVPVYIENDGKCAVWAEYWKGALKGKRSGVVLALGTAVAGGILLDGKVWKGRHFSAGELSYLCSDREKWKEKDGTTGYNCSAVNFINEVCERINYQGEDSGQKVFEEIGRQNPEVLEIFQEYLGKIAAQIYNIQIMLDPDVIAIGGGISKQKILLEKLQEEVERFYADGYWTGDNTFLPRPVLKLCKYGNDANLIGALYNYLMKETTEV